MPLSQREAEISWWIGEGFTDREIAILLGISPRTVHSHRDHILRKLKVRTRAAIAVWIVKKYYGLLSVVWRHWRRWREVWRRRSELSW
ncbi:MAG TPA: helix-turn-helix transcriptional regulator [Chthoniobacterales bacterium]